MRATRLCILCLHLKIAATQPSAQRVCWRCTEAEEERARKAALPPREVDLERALIEALACMQRRMHSDRECRFPFDEDMAGAITHIAEVLA